MKSISRYLHLVAVSIVAFGGTQPGVTGAASAQSAPASDYESLRASFAAPDHATWGEVPLWWWEGAPMTRERVTWELELLAAKGVKSVCPIQRSPGRCDPQSFDPDWWEMFRFAHEECRRLGMKLWAYDQVGYGHYGWLEKAAAGVNSPDTRRVTFHTAEGAGGVPIRLELPEGELIAARAYRVTDGVARDADSVDLSGALRARALEWRPPNGSWRVAASVVSPYTSFYLNDEATEAFIDMLYGKIERTLGEAAMGSSFAGVFQDEHPLTPRDIYTEELARTFRERCGYEMGRAIPALHFDVGPPTPKYRTDFFDVYLSVVESTYWKRVYEWTEARGILTSHDNWGRRDINRQSQGYIDYFRTQRWYSAPGFDDAGVRPVTERNYYDTRIASSIARLYGRPRVWNEAFHSSGWGRTTEQTLTWLSAGLAVGANLYDEHGLYYAVNASTWEHAAPDPHWRQPYWKYYGTLSDWVARTSYVMSQGRHVVDAAVHYPVVSLLAGDPPGAGKLDYNFYMELSRTIYNAGIDNDIVDDDSILNASVRDGALHMGGNGYRALVFGPERTVRRGVLEKALELARSGGTVLFYGQLPTATTDGGRDDPRLPELLRKLLGAAPAEAERSRSTHRSFGGGGFCAFVQQPPATLPRLISEHIRRDFEAPGQQVFVSHRRVGETHVYLVQNVQEGPLDLEARFRVDGVPERWDPFTGKICPVDRFLREGGSTSVSLRLEGNVAEFLVFRPGDASSGDNGAKPGGTVRRALPSDWAFSVIPTRDNRWGEFRWPPSNASLGPEVRTFRYREEDEDTDVSANWHRPALDDSGWSEVLYSTGPYWLCLTASADDNAVVGELLADPRGIIAGARGASTATEAIWRDIVFSKTIGLAKAVPWGGHSGYPDGHIDRSFIDLPEGRKLLFTRLRCSEPRRRGLRVELNQPSARLWVNGEEQPFEQAVGNLPLRQGENTVLLDLPAGSKGRLFVQAVPPSVASMADAGEGKLAPKLRAADWIWAGDSPACHVRKTFTLERRPTRALLVVSAFSGYRLFVNGTKVEEEIGPWADWTKPETLNVTPYLRSGRNVIALWGQLYTDVHKNKGPEAFASKGIVLALAVKDATGNVTHVLSDATWRGRVDEQRRWTEPGFDDRSWAAVRVRGEMGDAPWGLRVVENLGRGTEPRRPLSIRLKSPYLECFEEAPDVVYDVKPSDAVRIGWVRFKAPPGLRELLLPTEAEARVWVDGREVQVTGGRARVAQPPEGLSTVAIRLRMKPGAYAGAAFREPIALTLEGGKIQPGPWTDYALPTFSGIGVYTQDLLLKPAEASGAITLDLGRVLVAAEVLVNDRSAGVRLARPFSFDLAGLVKPGKNVVEIRVANTIAPHYTTIPAMHIGPTASGLLGPVTLEVEAE